MAQNLKILGSRVTVKIMNPFVIHVAQKIGHKNELVYMNTCTINFICMLGAKTGMISDACSVSSIQNRKLAMEKVQKRR